MTWIRFFTMKSEISLARYRHYCHIVKKLNAYSLHCDPKDIFKDPPLRPQVSFLDHLQRHRSTRTPLLSSIRNSRSKRFLQKSHRPPLVISDVNTNLPLSDGHKLLPGTTWSAKEKQLRQRYLRWKPERKRLIHLPFPVLCLDHLWSLRLLHQQSYSCTIEV